LRAQGRDECWDKVIAAADVFFRSHTRPGAPVETS
jgi:hypothetical protein